MPRRSGIHGPTAQAHFFRADTYGRQSIPVQGCDLCLTGDSQCSSFHKRCEKNENGDFCQTSASCGEGFGFTDEDKCGACIPLVECLGCPDHSIGTCDCEKCSGGFNDVFGIRAESECSVAPDQECSTEYGHCQGSNSTSYTAQSTDTLNNAQLNFQLRWLSFQYRMR